MEQATTAAADIEAPLLYVIDTGERLVNQASIAGVRGEQRGGTYEPHRCIVHDGRAAVEPIRLDTHGFELVRHKSRVADFYDEAVVRSDYEREVKTLLTDVLGAAKVVVFDHTWRADSERLRDEKVVREPGRSMHNDYTERSAPQRVRDLLPPAEAEARLARRFAIVNVWRPLVGPVRTAPLAICDARSVAAADLVVTERRVPGRIGEIYQLAYNPAHRWFYFPRMRPDEALLIKVFDTATDGRARFAPHGAFDDPSAPADAPPRESIETRTLVFF